MFRFVVGLILLTSLIIGVLWLGATRLWWEMPLLGVELILILAAFNWILFRYLQKIKQSSSANFNMFYLLSIALKLLGGLMVLGVIFWIDKAGAFAHAIIFLITYLLFTALEVVFLMNRK